MEAWSRQIQSQHDISVQSYEYSPGPPTHMGKVLPFLPGISHNTGRPHNAFCPRLPVSCLSADREEYHEDQHPPPLYNAHHWLPQGQSLFLRAYGEVPDLPVSAQEFHDPVIPGRNSLCQKYPDNEELLPLHPHTCLSEDIWQPHLQGRHLRQ